MDPEAFFTLHSDLPREGPGCRADLDWACALAGIAPNARILDAGCGPGADIGGLLAHAPEGSVLAVDKHARFVDAARSLHKGDPRVTAQVGDMAEIAGSFDFIWSAGALYFLGIRAGLDLMARKLAPNGAIAFSHLVYTVAAPDPALEEAFATEPDVMGQAELQSLIEGAGVRIEGQRLLPNASWDAYYEPMRARIAQLRGTDDPVLEGVLDAHEDEIRMRDEFGAQFGYVLLVVRPQ